MRKTIEQAFENVDQLKNPKVLETIEACLEDLDQGRLRICEKINDIWVTHEWLKKAILLYFKTKEISVLHAGDFTYCDKIPVKQWTLQKKIRVVPPAVVRKGSFVAEGCILMPSFVNIGAYVDAGTMIDTWATVGSCAQIGKNVHVSGGVGIGGVLEPPQARPVIIEDNCFLGSRAIVVEGVHLKPRVILGAGVTITASTKIIDVTGSKEKIYQGEVPENSVVIPGTLQKKFAAGEYGVNCALIIGQRKASSDEKTSLNQALREFQVSV